MIEREKSQTRILRLPEVERRVGYKKSWIYQAIKEDKFPAPIKLGERAIGWIEKEIDDWIAERIQKHRA